MTPEIFLEFLKSIGKLSALSKNPIKEEWQKIKKAIEPHYLAEIPEILKTQFPNEDSKILEYRKDTYQPKTEAPLVDAIDELQRLLSESKFSVRYESANMEQYATSTNLGGEFQDKTIVSAFLDVFPRERPIDPNGVFLVNVKGEGLVNDAQPVEIAYEVISSCRVRYRDETLGVLIYDVQETRADKINALAGVNLSVNWVVVTDMFYGLLTSKDGETTLVVRYRHNLGRLPFVVFGGRAVQIKKGDKFFKVYRSDLSAAIPYLNDAAISDNQTKSVILSSAFPLRFVKGIECRACNGMGIVKNPEKPDEAINCKSCGGNGKVLPLSPLASYYLLPPAQGRSAEEKRLDAQVKPVEFVSPPVDTMKLTSEYAEKQLAKAEEVLNIKEQINQAQSGAAKEIDREPKYIKISKISEDTFRKLKYVLEVIQGLRFLDTSSSIVVNAPTSFDLKTEVELMSEFLKTLEGSPDVIRLSSYNDYLKRRFSSDRVAQRIGEICPRYTILYLYTNDERDALFSSMTITQDDNVRATFCFSALLDLYEKGEVDIFNDDIDTIREKIDEKLAPRFEVARDDRPPVEE